MKSNQTPLRKQIHTDIAYHIIRLIVEKERKIKGKRIAKAHNNWLKDKQNIQISFCGHVRAMWNTSVYQSFEDFRNSI